MCPLLLKREPRGITIPMFPALLPLAAALLLQDPPHESPPTIVAAAVRAVEGGPA